MVWDKVDKGGKWTREKKKKKALKLMRIWSSIKKRLMQLWPFLSYQNIFPLKKDTLAPDQIRRSSRSVCANFAEAWRKRRYQASFVAKLNDCEAEAAETQVWLKFAVKCDYISTEQGRELYSTYNQILSGLVKMINRPESWLIAWGMSHNKYLKDWSRIVSSHFPHLSLPEVAGLATWSFGMVITGSSSITPSVRIYC